MLVVFSDMRQATDTLNLERADNFGNVQALHSVSNAGLLANLHGVEVAALVRFRPRFRNN